MKNLITILLLTTLTTALPAQIYWQNGSFEGEPQDATVPVNWLPCEPGTTPDILPGYWGVYQEPSDGDTYVGLITRSDGTWESIAQRLSRTIKPLECWAFKVDLAHSLTYAGYSRPVKLRIWGGGRKCQKQQLLFETGFIEHTSWKSYTIEFRADKPINYIIFEAFYSEGSFSNEGNILLDNLSPLYPCPRA